MRLSLLLLALIALTLPAWQPAQAAGIIFRYLPAQPTLSSDVVAAGLATGLYLDPRERVARGPGGWGLQAPYASRFQGGGSTLRSTAAEPLSQALGPRLTVEAWVALADLSGPTILVTNRISGAGNVTLGLDGATPYFVLTAGGQDVRVEAPRPVALGTPVWIAATARFDVGAQQLYVTLYVDGHLAATTAVGLQVPSPYVIQRPFFVGTAATGTPGAFTVEGKLSGHLFGAVVRDYVAHDAYLTSSIPHDGSFYFGLPDYHDYSLATFHTPMDQRIKTSPTPVRHRFYVPYVNDEFVPQGTATHVAVAGADTTALVYLSYYHLTRSGTTGQRRSIVAEIDAATGHVRRAFRLMGELAYSHAGGIAYVDGALYVSSSSRLERYPLPPYQGPDAERYADLAPDPDGTISVYSRASFVSAHNDTLWVGDWRTASQNAPYLYGYPLGSDGRPVPGGEPRIFALPRNVQGVDFFEHRGKTLVFMARNTSQSRGEAEILRVPYANLSRWSEPRADSSIVVPYGIEDLSFFPDGTLWTNSESGADYYQKSANAWTVFYPFVYSLSARTVFGEDIVTSASPTPRPADSIELSAAPSPFRDTTTLTIETGRGGHARIRVTDALGRHVATLHDAPLGAGLQTFRWTAGAAASGLYFVVLDVDGRRIVRPVMLAR